MIEKLGLGLKSSCLKDKNERRIVLGAGWGGGGENMIIYSQTCLFSLTVLGDSNLMAT
jgi:hypothetical protein